jgi:uncharacterized secreted protein with C-terminal beta-propeller domain
MNIEVFLSAVGGAALPLAVIAFWANNYFSKYLAKKAENLATHEDIEKLLEQVSAVTTATKHIEAKISNEMWRRERKYDLELKTIESVSLLTTEFIQRSIADSDYRPSVEWFSAFSVADCAVKALFDDEAYGSFKALEILIGPGIGPAAVFAVSQFIEKRDAAIKSMYSDVFDNAT